MRVPAVVSCVLLACGNDEPTPVEKCDELLSLVCDRAEECVSASVIHADCVELLRRDIPCGTVKKVSESYDRCMVQLETDSCTTLFPSGSLILPADCMGVVLR